MQCTDRTLEGIWAHFWWLCRK